MSRSNANKRPSPNGWQQLRMEREQTFTGNFRPLKHFINRNEFIGSVAELFINALVGVGRIRLQDQTDPYSAEQENTKPEQQTK